MSFFKKYKNIILFLVKFFVMYFALFALYAYYLKNSQQKENTFKTASITTKVAEQTVSILRFAGYDIEKQQHDKELSVKLILEGEYTARVIEGCNSISIIILFISFIIAFTGSVKATILFSVLGSILIYTINILRIAFLTVMIYEYPDYQDILHGIIFPAAIYGTIFLLWFFWVNNFSNYKK